MNSVYGSFVAHDETVDLIDTQSGDPTRYYDLFLIRGWKYIWLTSNELAILGLVDMGYFNEGFVLWRRNFSTTPFAPNGGSFGVSRSHTSRF